MALQETERLATVAVIVAFPLCKYVTLQTDLHTRKLLDIAVIDFASDKDAGHLLSQFLSNSREDGIKIINQLFQTSLHVAST